MPALPTTETITEVSVTLTDPLFVVDTTPYSRDDIDRAVAALCRYPAIAAPQGRRLAVCLKDSFQWLALCLHLKAQGGSVLPIHPATPVEAARDLARETGCHHLLLDDGATLEVLTPKAECAAAEIAPGGELIQLSSGTTGRPKTIVRSWAAIDRELESYIEAFPEAEGLTPIVACPITHSYGLICGVLAGLRRRQGQGPVPRVITNLNPRYILGTLRDHPRHLLYASPTLVSLLVRMLPQEQGLHTVMLSGAALPAALLETLHARARRVCQQYGCSEVGCIALAASADSPGLMGRPLGHLRVSAGHAAEAPEEIRVVVEGAGERVIATRDLGYLDAQGRLHFLARLDDTINVAGINVYPGDVEDVFLRHPQIDDAVAFKRPDPYAGERVCLQFVAREPLGGEALRRWCRERLAPHQVPMLMEQVAYIDKLPNGKVSRQRLAQAHIGSGTTAPGAAVEGVAP
ncbi:AMP-binding protein [Halomonas daqingensis]|uniref:AMP-binding protein n=1 Tax=Billgrantia desiderata TaxID=52021 RepID=A0ABS9BBS2_9GAMM|nr:AMP-binding protein [Halomonas desiderata]MCE8044881.1 AMP-binding protein [Halomonas desiderata]MCE8049455.1 AMP-binding protein [Halomonas desiderata]